MTDEDVQALGAHDRPDREQEGHHRRLAGPVPDLRLDRTGQPGLPVIGAVIVGFGLVILAATVYVMISL